MANNPEVSVRHGYFLEKNLTLSMHEKVLFGFVFCFHAPERNRGRCFLSGAHGCLILIPEMKERSVYFYWPGHTGNNLLSSILTEVTCIFKKKKKNSSWLEVIG